MPQISVDRTGLAQTVLVCLVTLAALTLLGWMLTYWAWGWFVDSRPKPAAQVTVEPTGNTATASALFGIAEREQGIAGPARVAIKLLGVVAASGGRRGYAIVQLDAKEILAVLEGDDIAPAVRLAEVHPNHVVVDRNGLTETLVWPEKNSSTDSLMPSEINSPAESLTPRNNE